MGIIGLKNLCQIANYEKLLPVTAFTFVEGILLEFMIKHKWNKTKIAPNFKWNAGL